MKVIDNFVPSVYQDALKKTLLSPNFPWFFEDKTVLENNFYISDSHQFIHNFYYGNQQSSSFFPLVEPIQYHLMISENIDTTRIIKVKANLNIKAAGSDTYAPHTDCKGATFSYITCIYYVNDSDGDTVLYDKDLNEIHRVTPKQGRLVYFDGNTLHAGHRPVNNELRCILNFNFEGDLNA